MLLQSFLLLVVLNSLTTPSLASIGSSVLHPQRKRFQNHRLLVRGGQQSEDPYQSYATYNDNTPPNYEDGYANYNPPSGNNGADHLFHETVQDRVDQWRTTQMQRSQNMSPMQEANPRDEQGRMKLLASVSKGSRALIFFVLMWRDIHLFEVADQALKGTARLFTVVPLAFLFIANMAGVVASITSPSHSTKKRLKAILNLDKLVEVLLMLWYTIRLTIAPTVNVPRELYISSFLHSVFFLIQCQAYTRVTWDQSVMPGMGGMEQSQSFQQQQTFQRGYQPTPVYASQQMEDRYQSYSSSPTTPNHM